MDISVVIPLLNEDESLPELAGWIEKVMIENDFSWEVTPMAKDLCDRTKRIEEKVNAK